MTGGVILFVFALLFVVLVHEGGHLLAAKIFGFKAPMFFVGFGPTLWSMKRGETEYGVKAFPLGGFVKIVGMNPFEEVRPEDEGRSYPNKPAWQRAILLVAGSATHWVLAFVMLLVALMAIGFPSGELTTEIASTEIGNQDETPAAEAGLRPGDRIVAIGGTPTESWDEIRRYIRDHERGTFTIERDGERKTIEVEMGRALFDREGRVLEFAGPEEELSAPETGQEVRLFLGVTPEERFDRLGLPSAVAESGKLVGSFTVQSLIGMREFGIQIVNGEMWRTLTTRGERQPDEGPIGIVGASRFAGENIARGRILEFVVFVAFFAVFIGLMNLLPLPPLDGGHLAVLALEKITGRPIDVRKVIPVAVVVIAFFVALTIAALYLDVVRPVDLF